MLLAGDVGGTKALVGLFLDGPGRPKLVDARAFATREYAGLEEVIDAFLAAQPPPVPPLKAASFGVAGPIVNQVARLTNVPWIVDASRLAASFRTSLLNDLQAMACSIECSADDWSSCRRRRADQERRGDCGHGPRRRCSPRRPVHRRQGPYRLRAAP
jgi:glucokinase